MPSCSRRSVSPAVQCARGELLCPQIVLPQIVQQTRCGALSGPGTSRLKCCVPAGAPPFCAVPHGLGKEHVLAELPFDKSFDPCRRPAISGNAVHAIVSGQGHTSCFFRRNTCIRTICLEKYCVPDVPASAWNELVRNFGRLFCIVAGKPVVIDSHTSRSGKHRYRARVAARDLLAKIRDLSLPPG